MVVTGAGALVILIWLGYVLLMSLLALI